MPLIFNNTTVKKVIYNDTELKKIIYNGVVVWQSGNNVTYVVDSTHSYTEFVNYDETCLSPTTFTPSLSGYSFLGWRQDKTASSSVLSTLKMGDNDITLYAVFTKNITVTYYDDSTTASTSTKAYYYNNGNASAPTFTLTQKAKTGYTAKGWSTSDAGNGSIALANGGTTAGLSSNVTYYGRYDKTITATYYDDSTTASTATGTYSYNSSGKTTNASIKLTQKAKSGWTAAGWATGTTGNATIALANGGTASLSADTTYYGRYNKTITVTYYDDSTTASTTTGTYSYNSSGNTINASIKLTQKAKTGYTAAGWATATTGNAAIALVNGGTASLSANATYYGRYNKTITATLYNGSNTASSATGTYCYNSSGNTTNASIKLSENAVTGWTKAGWTTSASGYSATIADGGNASIATDTTYYSLYTAGVTVTKYDNSATATTETKNRVANYHTSTTYSNPSFTLTQATKSGYTAKGWSTSNAGNGAIAIANGGSTGAISANATYYGRYDKTITATLYNGATTTSTATGTYQWNSSGNAVNASIKLTQNAVTNWTKAGWTTSASGYSATIADGGSASINTDTTYYSLYTSAVTITKYNGSTTATTESKNRVANYHSAITYSNPSFTLTENAVSGWTAAGWTTSTSGYTATIANKGSTGALSSNATYYSLYTVSIKLTKYDDSTTATSESKNRVANYHTAVTYSNPSFTLTQKAKTGYTAAGWSTSDAGNGAIAVANGGSVTLSANGTYYGRYNKTINVTYYNNSTTASKTTGTYCYNSSGKTTNASVVLTQASKSGWTARGWATGTAANATIVLANGGTASLSADATYYGCYYITITLSTIADGKTTNTNGNRLYNSAGNSSNPKFTIADPKKSGSTFQGWSTSTAATVTYTTINNLELSANTTLRAVWGAADTTITLNKVYNGGTGWNAGYGSAWLSGQLASGLTLYSGIDNTKYSSAIVTYTGTCGGSSGSNFTTLRLNYSTIGSPGDMFKLENGKGWSGTDSRTITLGTTGTTDIVLDANGSGNGWYDINLTFTTLKLTGRSSVG